MLFAEQLKFRIFKTKGDSEDFQYRWSVDVVQAASMQAIYDAASDEVHNLGLGVSESMR